MIGVWVKTSCDILLDELTFWFLMKMSNTDGSYENIDFDASRQVQLEAS
jgi:hypothetical protein